MHRRNGNAKLGGVIAEAGLSHAQLARAFVRVAAENEIHELMSVGRSHISHWVRGAQPSGRAPIVLCEALSRRLGRLVTPHELGLTTDPRSALCALDCDVDTRIALTNLGGVEVVPHRRHLLGAAVYSVAALVLPRGRWST